MVSSNNDLTHLSNNFNNNGRFLFTALHISTEKKRGVGKKLTRDLVTILIFLCGLFRGRKEEAIGFGVSGPTVLAR
jgi:hypothetical protein